MKEFIDKLIGRLEEDIKYVENYIKALEESELAEEHKDKVMINEQYCWQSCGAVEHCKECNRLCNGSIDYYENYDFMAEEYNGGWIPCSERLPEADGWVLTCDKEGNIHIFFYANGYFCESFGCRKITEKHERFYVPIAWQLLPEPYKE